MKSIVVCMFIFLGISCVTDIGKVCAQESPGDEKHEVIASIEAFRKQCQGEAGGLINCLTEEEALWDKQMNKYYKLLMGILDKESRSILKRSQLAWLKYRDAESENAWRLYPLHEGSAYSEIAAAEVMELTEARTKSLMGYYETLLEELDNRRIKKFPEAK
jgi:uncharacterized protein YecT (DUF1311 family)